MRLFQNIAACSSYLPHLDGMCGASFARRLKAFREERLNGVHVLEPINDGKAGAVLTCSAAGELVLKTARDHA